MIDHVILHVENAADGIACAILHETRSERFRVFGPSDVNQLRERLFLADWISGYNLLRASYPLLWGSDWNTFRLGNHFRPLSARTNDLVRRLCLAQGLHPDMTPDKHQEWTLDALAQGTLGKNRAGNGTEAALYHQAGNWPAVVSFALDAAQLTVDLIYFVERYGYVVHGFTGQHIDLRQAGHRSPLRDRLTPQPEGALHGNREIGLGWPLPARPPGDGHPAGRPAPG
jgi:hypothetical protein